MITTIYVFKYISDGHLWKELVDNLDGGYSNFGYISTLNDKGSSQVVSELFSQYHKSGKKEA